VGAKLVLEMPGGGGYGDPHDRPLAVIERDLKKGYISEAAARDLYGVRFGPDGSLRREETN
jgi:N-methylhydantoinase B